MPKKITTKIAELGAVEFGTLLQEGKIVKMRAGKVTIEHAKTKRGKTTTTVYHVNLRPQIVHLETDVDAEAPVAAKPRKAAEPKAKKPRKAKAEETPKKPGKKRGRKPKAAPAAELTAEPTTPVAVAPKKPGRRKARVQPTEAEKPVVPKSAAPKPAKEKAAAAHIPWNEDLEEGDFEL